MAHLGIRNTDLAVFGHPLANPGPAGRVRFQVLRPQSLQGLRRHDQRRRLSFPREVGANPAWEGIQLVAPPLLSQPKVTVLG